MSDEALKEYIEYYKIDTEEIGIEKYFSENWENDRRY